MGLELKTIDNQGKRQTLKNQGTKFDELLVSVRVEIDSKVYIDTNQNARAPILADPNKPTLITENIANKAPAKNGATYPNANMAEAHAEIGAIQQAYEKGVTKGKDMVIHVQGRDVCTYCRNDIATAAKNAGLKSVTVHAVNKDGKPVIYDWNETMSSIKLRKE
ncbi:deaminase [Glaesserella sp.]|uniref:cytidine deaminase-like fold-containing protein n=1 Tax=Glaesserella sp. TaxID=2094731 RepID=UPI00359FF0F7